MQNCSVQSGITLHVHWSLLQWSILMEMWNLDHNDIMYMLILYVQASLQSALHASRWFKSKKHEIEVSLAWLCTNISTGRCKSTHPPSNESGAEGRMGGWRGCTYKEWCRQQQQQQCSMFTLPSADKRHCSTSRSILAPPLQSSDQWCCKVLELPWFWCYPLTRTSCLNCAFFQRANILLRRAYT